MVKVPVKVRREVAVWFDSSEPLRTTVQYKQRVLCVVRSSLKRFERVEPHRTLTKYLSTGVLCESSSTVINIPHKLSRSMERKKDYISMYLWRGSEESNHIDHRSTLREFGVVRSSLKRFELLQSTLLIQEYFQCEHKSSVWFDSSNYMWNSHTVMFA